MEVTLTQPAIAAAALLYTCGVFGAYVVMLGAGLDRRFALLALVWLPFFPVAGLIVLVGGLAYFLGLRK